MFRFRLCFLFFYWHATFGFENYLWLLGRCYDIPNADGFNHELFIDGTWYEIERYSATFEDNLQCVNVKFFIDLDTYHWYISFSGIFPNGTTNRLIAETRPLNDSSYMGARFPGDSTWSSFRILSTDYFNYGIIYSCREELKTDPPEKQERLWILGRQPILTTLIEQKISDLMLWNGNDLHVYTDKVIHNCTDKND